ncbi:DUF350 domain-containing protein [bacterium]|nr:DUF350 domain-containing protein [bacterium]
MNAEFRFTEFISLDGIDTLNHFPNLLLILLVLLLMWAGKKIFDLFTSYSIEHQMVKEDNKAITVCFVGYLTGVALILEGVLETPSRGLWRDLLDVSVWGLIGIVLLNVAGKINDRIILHRFKNIEELLNRRNISVGVAMAGSYLGSAVIIRGIIIGESLGWFYDIGLTLFYFILAQLAFFLSAFLHQIVTRYDFHKEIQENNVAAGISFGATLVSVGILLSIPLRTSYSLVVFAAWFILGSAVMAFFRFVMDHVIIPQEKLDEEIHQDQNWGIALLEGCFAITAVITLQSIFV